MGSNPGRPVCKEKKELLNLLDEPHSMLKVFRRQFCYKRSQNLVCLWVSKKEFSGTNVGYFGFYVRHTLHTLNMNVVRNSVKGAIYFRTSRTLMAKYDFKIRFVVRNVRESL
jgi:hypothetical protein